MIRKIAVLGAADFTDQPALERWFNELPEGTVLLPLMGDGRTVSWLRVLARRKNISVTTRMSPSEKWELANEVVIFGEMEFGATRRAMESDLPFTIVLEASEDDDPPWEQLSLV